MIKNVFILNFLKLYNIIWKLVLPFLAHNRRLKHNFHKRITSLHLAPSDLWIQAASAGEAYLAVSLLKCLAPKKKIKILVTSTTSQGIDILKSRLIKKEIHKFIDLKIDQFPFDMPHIIKKTVEAINPCVMILLETEIWPALLFYLKQNKTKIFIINARLSKKSFHSYLKTRWLWKHLAPDYILATSDRDAKRYERIFENTAVKTMSNIKFDSIETGIRDMDRFLQIKKIFSSPMPLTILASVRKQEEKDIILLIINILNAFPNQIVALFPRHMNRINSWEKLLVSRNLNVYLRSQIKSAVTTPGVILWDTFGELKQVYNLAEVVFVGGSLKPLGGQNFIEPAIAGAVTVTGPYDDDFAWAGNDIFQKKIVIKKNHWKSIARTIVQTLEIPVNTSHHKQLVQQYLQSKQGGSKQACNEILKVFDQSV